MAKENKPASAYTGFEYPQGGGNDIGVYKQPMENPNKGNDVYIRGNQTDTINISAGNVSKNMLAPENPYGVKESWMVTIPEPATLLLFAAGVVLMKRNK